MDALRRQTVTTRINLLKKEKITEIIGVTDKPDVTEKE
jgi:hypothetical protein